MPGVPDPLDQQIEALEQQAAELRSLLGLREAKRPLIVEFSGTPKAGKTMAISALRLFLRRNGITADTLAERASVAPDLPKGTLDFNAWVSCASLTGMLGCMYTQSDIFILDRGLFDALIWNSWLERTAKITREDADVFARFFCLSEWSRRVDLVCVMLCSPEASIERELAGQLTRKRGSIMDPRIIQQVNDAISDTMKCHGGAFKRVIPIDTTKMAPIDGVTKITREMLSALREFLDEPIRVIHRDALPFELPPAGFSPGRDLLGKFADAVERSGALVRKSEAENAPEYLIPVPCAIVTFDEKVLILKRKDPGHSLHDTLAVWAGGHVSDADCKRRGVLENTLRRELSEELAIKGKYEIEPLGLVRTTEDERASRHIGVV